MTDENDNRPGRAPLTLKPRTGQISTGTVKQSFSHGRSKTVVVETKRRINAPPVNLAAPQKSPAFDVRGPAPTRAAPEAQSAGGLSEEERRARQRVIEARLAQERLNAERAAREDEARRREEDARRKADEARRAETAAEAPAPAAPPPTPAAEIPASAPPIAAATAEPAPRVEAATPTPRPEPRPAPPTQTRTYEPGAARRDDRASTTTYRPERPAARAEPGAFAPRGPRPEGGYPPRAPREGGYQGGAPRGERPPARPGETVRYSALSPRPAPT